MYYWLYTEGYRFLSALPILLALVCLSMVLPMVAAARLGADIRRTREHNPTGLRLFRVFNHMILSMSLTAIYVVITRHFALEQAYSPPRTSWLKYWIGTTPSWVSDKRLLMFSIGHVVMIVLANIGLHQSLRSSGYLRSLMDNFNNHNPKRGEFGSSHFCTMAEYKRYRKPDPQGMTFYGAFWGEDERRLDRGRGEFCLNGEDLARGVVTIGGPGSGKSQSVILPTIADRMASGHSIIVADPQGELTGKVIDIAKVTGHLVIVHDPTSERGPRFNLAADVRTVADARAIAGVLVPSMGGDNAFWAESAIALLAGCLLCFDNLGQIHAALGDLQQLAQTLKQNETATLLATAFMSNAEAKDPKMASSIIATLGTALTGWSDPEVRRNTERNDFDARLITGQPTAVVITCPGRTRAVYAKYLGAVITKLLQDLDTIGEEQGGALPVPVGLILDEFPQLGRLDRLVADVNLVRKRRISIMIAAQTMGQFKMIYDQNGTESLFAGLATQIIFGGCDQETAEYYAKSSGRTTQLLKAPEGQRDYKSQRDLLTSDEIKAPAKGNLTIFARYVEPGYAIQTIIQARLTRFYERQDWQRDIQLTPGKSAMLQQRGASLKQWRSDYQNPIRVLNPMATFKKHTLENEHGWQASSADHPSQTHIDEPNKKQPSGYLDSLLGVTTPPFTGIDVLNERIQQLAQRQGR